MTFDNYCNWAVSNSFDFDSEEQEYLTSCGNEFIIISGTPKDNKFKYCPYCGGNLVEDEDER